HSAPNISGDQSSMVWETGRPNMPVAVPADQQRSSLALPASTSGSRGRTVHRHGKCGPSPTTPTNRPPHLHPPAVHARPDRPELRSTGAAHAAIAGCLLEARFPKLCLLKIAVAHDPAGRSALTRQPARANLSSALAPVVRSSS